MDGVHQSDTVFRYLQTSQDCQPVITRYTHTHTHTRLTAVSPGIPRWAGTRKVKPIWILLKQEIVSGSGISWAVCKSAPRSRQITTPAPHHSVFHRPDALPAAQPPKALKANSNHRIMQLKTRLRQALNEGQKQNISNCSYCSHCYISFTDTEDDFSIRK